MHGLHDCDSVDDATRRYQAGVDFRCKNASAFTSAPPLQLREEEGETSESTCTTTCIAVCGCYVGMLARSGIPLKAVLACFSGLPGTEVSGYMNSCGSRALGKDLPARRRGIRVWSQYDIHVTVMNEVPSVKRGT